MNLLKLQRLCLMRGQALTAQWQPTAVIATTSYDARVFLFTVGSPKIMERVELVVVTEAYPAVPLITQSYCAMAFHRRC
jgi:hypothetical protein